MTPRSGTREDTMKAVELDFMTALGLTGFALSMATVLAVIMM